MAISGVAQFLDGIQQRWRTDDTGDYHAMIELISPDEPAWHSYRSDGSATRSTQYREMIDRVLDDGNLTAPGSSPAHPPASASGFEPKPKRRQGRINQQHASLNYRPLTTLGLSVAVDSRR